MKVEPKKIINHQQWSSGQQHLSSQESSTSFYKTNKKKYLSKNKVLGTASTHYTDPSIDKRCTKAFNPCGPVLRINFDDYSTYMQDQSGEEMDGYSLEPNLSAQQRQNETESQNLGYCASQMEDDLPQICLNLIQEQTYQNVFDNQDENDSYQDENSNVMRAQSNVETILIPQNNHLLRHQQNRTIQVEQQQQQQQQQQNVSSSMDMIAENVYQARTESTYQMNGYQNNTNNNTNNNNNNDNIMNNENDKQFLQPTNNNNNNNKNSSSRNKQERKLLGDITEQHKAPIITSQFEEEEYQYNHHHDQDENHNSDREESNIDNEGSQGNLFNPVDHMHFIDDDNQYEDRGDSYSHDQYNESIGFNAFFRNNEQAILQIKQSNEIMNRTSSNQRAPLQQKRELTMKQMLDNFQQDDVFGFDDQDYLILKQREADYQINPEILRNYSGNFTNFPKKRAILIDWMQEVSSSLSFKRETYQQSISIVDRYFQLIPMVPKNQLQLAGATALLIAHKIEEVVCWKIQDFIMACNYGYTHEQFLEMEINICKTLSFNLSSTTPYFWMNQLMLQWDGFCEQFEQLFENDMIYFKKNKQRSFKLFSQVCQYIDCSLYDINVYEYQMKHIIICFMYWTLYQNIDIVTNEIKLNYLDEIFEHFIQNSLNLNQGNDIQQAKSFTYQYLPMQINEQVPNTPSNNRREDNHYQSYENVCSQQLYNQDARRLFGI